MSIEQRVADKVVTRRMQVGSGQLHELQRKTKDLGIFAADPQVKVLFVPQLQQHARAYFDGYINQDVLQFGVE